MAAPRRRAARAWWRAPVLRSAPRRRAEAILGVTAAAALVLGTGAGAAVEALTDDAATAADGEVAQLTELGPVTIALPDDVGPWAPAPAAAAAELRESWDGPVEIDGVWGALAPGSLVVTVLTAEAGSHGGVAQFEGSVPGEDDALWAGDGEHAAGSRTADDLRELVLVVESGDGDLVVLSVSGPPDAFASGSLAEAFRTAQVT